MTDLSKITKIFQGLLNHNILLNEDYYKITKICHKNAKKLEALKQQVTFKKQEIEKLSQTKDDLARIIEKRKNFEKIKTTQMNELKEEIKELLDQYNSLESNILSKIVDVIETDHENTYKRRLYLKLLRFCTKVFIDGNTPPTMIRGFAANDIDKTLFPFEFDTRMLSENDIITEMWELSRKTSKNPNDWEKLFSI